MCSVCTAEHGLFSTSQRYDDGEYCKEDVETDEGDCGEFRGVHEVGELGHCLLFCVVSWWCLVLLTTVHAQRVTVKTQPKCPARKFSGGIGEGRGRVGDEGLSALLGWCICSG